MQKLSFIIVSIFLLSAANMWGQTSPHGKIDFDCSDCHVSTSWKDIPAQKKFSHDATTFLLVGQHKTVACKQCHETLKFSEAKEDCASCHKDIHQNTVSVQCNNCHTPTSWLIKNITDIHQRSRFPLLGQHAKADCQQCHTRYSELNFEPLGVKCYDCHRQNYAATQNPNHAQLGFSTDCESCHSFTDAAWGYASFAHDFFPLVGGHKISNCFSCHKVGTYTGLSKDCYSCHKSHYDQTTNPKHSSAGFSTNCATCHTINGWKPSSFNHAQYFVLVGAHTSLACNQCHSTTFKGTPTDCYGCHKGTFEATTNPNHVTSQFPTDCTKCHGTTAWIPSTFNHANTSFPLTGIHATTSCIACHATGYINISTDCYSCHKKNYDATTNPNHAANQIPTTCGTCHSTSGWTPTTFDHSKTTFPLTGAHTTVSCASCHTNGYTGTSTDCYSCHKKNYDATTNPNHVTSNFPTTCNTCHTTTAWKPASFDHSKTKFPLTGAHTTVDCSKCHANGYTGTSTDCYSCHKSNYDNTTNPKHSTAGFATSCKDCHSTTAWTPATFDHSQYFPIASGRHSGIACTTCHNSTNYTIFTCLTGNCHPKSSTDSKHIGEVNGYSYVSTECYRCHPTGRGGEAFNHGTSGLPLSGAHLAISCESCHTPTSAKLSPECTSCHQNNFASAVNPNHQAIGISTDCKSCHTADGWKPSTFSHATTNFQLAGKHTSTSCGDCHKGKTTGTSQVCDDCHQANFTNSVNPNHQNLGINTDCKGCHTSDGWKPSTFNHATTNFQLAGKHTTTACGDCHKGKTTGTSQVCYDCHQSNFTNSLNPNHQTVGISTDCKSCHSSDGWTPSTFNHASTTFQLSGGHTKAACSDCHKGQTTGTSQICNDCHQQSFANSKNPNHTSIGLSTDCKSCHTSAAWIPSSFSHSTTNFQLTGGHTSVACADCHIGKTTGTSTVCYDCHKAKYEGVADPNHVAANFSQDCTTCHSTTAWKPSTFNHANTKFPLTGAHTSATCVDCHATGYTNTSTDCYSCHKPKYDATTNPKHSTAGFTTACADCHTTTAWTPATFDHTSFFPIKSGDHSKIACATCHNTSSYSNFTCLTSSCHTKSSTDRKHVGKVQGYSYVSSECYRCHPRGKADAIRNFIKDQRN